LGTEDILPLSAEHKKNLGVLEERILKFLPERQEETSEPDSIRIALIGRINVGKSSLVNRLCGQEKLIVSEIPGTTRDTTDTVILRNKKSFCLVDTAGIRKLGRTRDTREKAGIIKAKKDILQADVICHIMDAMEFPTRQDTAIAHLAFDSGKPLVILLNKWDLIPKETNTSKEFCQRLRSKMDFVAYAPVLFVSALSGQRTVKMLDLAEEVYESGRKKISTSHLNGFLRWVNQHHPPLSVHKRKIKIKYMVQKGILPPTFLLFSHSRAPLLPAYEKFFIHQLRESFGFTGTPLRIFMRSN
jgi:GTP-binding protein